MSGTRTVADRSWWTLERVTALLLWVVLAWVVLLSSAGSFAVDTKPEIYLAPWHSAAAYLSAWQADPQLGFPSFNVGLAPVAVTVGLIQALGVPAALSVRVLRLLLLVAGSWGTARLYGALRPAGERAGIGPLVAGTVAVANPYLVVAGATQPILLPWALLPWQLLCLMYALRAARDGARGWRAWRWPAGVALTFAAMSGGNAGVVPLIQLLAVPVLVVVLHGSEAVPWRAAIGAVARSAALVVAVSVYWVVPSLLALGAGATVVDNSETPQGVAAPSSAAEALRGLGLWPLYGSGGRGLWLPQFSAYLDSPVVVIASFALPVLAAVAAATARGTSRRLGLGLLLLAVPVMVGLFPADRPSPFGELLRWSFDGVPFAGAFRTTNKIGALLVLGVALLVAGGAAAAWRRWLGTAPRSAVAVGLAAVLAAGTAPAWTGNLYVSTVDLPSYWRQAAAALDAGPADQRVWFVPGEAAAAYRWSQDRPDDLSTSLLNRPSLVRTVIPVTAPAAANLLAAVDTGLQQGTLPPGALSTAARYLGAGDLLLRNDVVWEAAGGGRPAVMQAQLGTDPGLLPRGTWGLPGENTSSPAVPPSSAFEAALPPLQRYGVAAARPVTRTESASGTVLVDGDGYALAPLAAAGLLPGSPTFRYAADLDPAELARVLPETARIVLTDTNRRRSIVPGRLGDSEGPLLPADADPGSTRALGPARTQTVLRVVGGAASATDVGSAFGPLPASSAENAVDGDSRTAWQFGDFNRAVGQSLTVHFTPRAVRGVTVTVRRGAVRISRVRLRIGDRTVEADVDAAGLVRWTPDRPVRADSVEVTVLATSGDGFGLVGIEEVSVPGVRLERVAQLPGTLQRLSAGLDEAGRAALRRTPVDVVLSRARGGELGDDEETGLSRDITLPVSRYFRPYGIVRPSVRLPETDLDVLAGAGTTVTATSTSRAFGLPTLRASQALDGRPDTAWVPGGPTVGQSLRIVAPKRRVDHVDVTQAARGREADWVTRVRVELDGVVVAEGSVGPGTSRVSFQPRMASRMRLVVLATRSGARDAVVRIGEVDFGRARIVPSAARAAAACVTVSTVDGRAVLMRPVQPVTTTGPAPWAGCGRIPLPSGVHAVRPVPGWQPDELVLRDAIGDRATAVTPEPPYRVERGRGTSRTVRVSGTTGSWYLVSGQAYDPRWRATVDGRDLGTPVLVDGYAAGWRVDLPGSDHVARIWYGPQRATDGALAASGAAVLGCLVLLLLRAPPQPFWRREAQPVTAVPVGPPRPSWVDDPGWTVPDEDPSVWARDAPEPDAPARPGALAGDDGTDGTGAGGASHRAVPLPTGLARVGSAWLALAALCWLLGGWPYAAAAVAVAGWHALREPAARTVILAAAAVLAAVPVTWLALRPDLPRLSARIVSDDLWPHRLAALGLLLLAVGVARAERHPDPDPEEKTP